MYLKYDTSYMIIHVHLTRATTKKIVVLNASFVCTVATGSTFAQTFQFFFISMNQPIILVIFHMIPSVELMDFYCFVTCSCWLAPHAFHFAFLVPLALIWLTNLIMFILIMKGITCDRPKGLQSTLKKSRMIALQVQAALCCCILMGTVYYTHAYNRLRKWLDASLRVLHCIQYNILQTVSCSLKRFSVL